MTIIGAIIGGGTAFFVMRASGEVALPIVLLLTAFSFWAAYRVGGAAITWLTKLDEYEP